MFFTSSEETEVSGFYASIKNKRIVQITTWLIKVKVFLNCIRSMR